MSTELDIQANKQQEKASVPAEYSSFKPLFSEEASQRFPPSRPWDHAIELKQDTPDTVDCKVYPMAQHEDKALEEFLDEQLAKGYIRPSKSQYALPSSSSKRKMENYDQYKTIDVSTDTPSAINTHYPSSPTSSQIFGEPLYFPNSMYDGDITMYASKKATNTKRPSKHAMDSLSPQSCFLAFATPPPPSKQ